MSETRANVKNNKAVMAAFLVRVIRMLERGQIQLAITRLQGLVDKLKK